MTELIIKQQLKAHGMTLSELSQRMDVSQGSLSTMIRGNMTLPTIERIAEIIGIEPYELFITKEQLAEEKERRYRQTVPRATVFCPCCGKAICVKLDIDN